MSTRLITIRAITPIHTGTGQGTGIIDLPIARETHTGWPVLEASGLKGALRDTCGALDQTYDKDQPELFYRLFGPPTSGAPDFAGALLPTNGTLLCFPIRSFQGTFAWVTCPHALARWQRDRELLKLPSLGDANGLTEGQIMLADQTGLVLNGTVYLEELELTPLPADESAVAVAVAREIARLVFPDDLEWRKRFTARFAIVSDVLFDALVRQYTVQSARIRLDDKSKTVATGALWYEEAIPAETIFSALWRIHERREGIDPVNGWDLIEQNLKQPVQFGGNKSVGRGFAWLQLAPEAANGDQK